MIGLALLAGPPSPARVYADETAQKLGAVAQPVRAAICGSLTSPPIFEVMEVLGKDEALGRLRDVLKA